MNKRDLPVIIVINEFKVMSNKKQEESKIINVFTVILLGIDFLAIILLYFQTRINEALYLPIIYLIICNVGLFLIKKHIKKN